MTHDGRHPLALRDEILELLYWLQGEGISSAATLAGMARFLAHPEPAVSEALEQLRTRGDVEQTADLEYRLTSDGRREAARRFAETFAGMTGQGHGECNDPDCDCHDHPDGPAACHARAHRHDH